MNGSVRPADREQLTVVGESDWTCARAQVPFVEWSKLSDQLSGFS